MAQPRILQSVVEKVAAKLEIELDSLEQVENDFRISKTRVAIGGLPQDSLDNRAAVLLQSHKRIPWKQVAKAVGVGTVKLQKLQNALRNYLLSAPTDTGPRTVGTQPSTAAKRRGTRHREPLYNPQNISVICFRLAGFLADPGGTEQRARQLLARIHAYRPPSSDAEQFRAYRYDLQRYAAAFEAAAVYCIEHGSSSSSGGGNSMLLTFDELVEASHAATLLEVQQIVPRVKELMQALDWGKPQLKQGSASTTKATRKRAAPSSKQPNASKKASSIKQPSAAKGRVNNTEEVPSTTTVVSRTEEDIFQEWKEQIFQSAIERHGTWAAAAEHVFQRHGMSSSNTSSAPTIESDAAGGVTD